MAIKQVQNFDCGECQFYFPMWFAAIEPIISFDADSSGEIVREMKAIASNQVLAHCHLGQPPLGQILLRNDFHILRV